MTTSGRIIVGTSQSLAGLQTLRFAIIESACTAIIATVSGTEFSDTIEADAAIRLSTGNVFGKADEAGRAVKGGPVRVRKFPEIAGNSIVRALD